MAAVIERSIILAQLARFVGIGILVAPLCHALQTLQTQAVEARLQALDGLIALEPMGVPMLGHAVVDSQAAAIAGVVVHITFSCVVVSICKDIEESEVGVLLMADRAEAIDKLVVGND